MRGGSSSFLFRRQSVIGSLTIDTVLSERHQADSTVTQQPVEEGSNIADHIVNEPETVVIEGIVSNTPITGGTRNAAQEVFNELYSLRDAKEVVTVVTGLVVYENMVITNISIPRDRGTGGLVRFTVELTRIIKAGTTFGFLFQAVLSTALGIAAQAGMPLNLGKMATNPATANLVSNATSALRRMF